MTSSNSQRRVVRAPADWVPDAGLVAAALENPSGVVAAIDREYVDDPDGYVPAEAVKGCWLVDENGALTGEFEENPNHGAPADDFARLASDDTFIGRLGFDPEEMIREQITAMLVEQVPGTIVEWIKVTDDPRQLTAGIHGAENRFTVTRVGIAIPVAFAAVSPSARREILWGVLTYAQTGMNDPATNRRRMWLDLRETLDWAEEQLQPRLFEEPGSRN
ncbi:hypothetical protein ACWDOP_16860 [Nocardia sp. NPDC003693]